MTGRRAQHHRSIRGGQALALIEAENPVALTQHLGDLRKLTLDQGQVKPRAGKAIDDIGGHLHRDPLPTAGPDRDAGAAEALGYLAAS
jgi:hypothetical protein